MISDIPFFPVVGAFVYHDERALIHVTADLFIGVCAYMCAKRKGFSPVALWAIACGIMAPFLIVLELCRSKNPGKTSLRLVEYFGTALVLFSIIVVFYEFFYQVKI
ncbi:hypothetical protein [Oecophyllibacter saccharovorans]|uniref:Uncharacterized protein n=1 Tax=Oecophyllibacter saccharovorans TaxID=2558360 RepID=A0A506UM24_9PROT|nr:hypothetical protein [Oecophyllibacter saccharovorans]TPW34404.1 hypothetical protein E3202_07925 [Oecophyllibacter saccharovorans]TPW36586.1 hypothetical protein E3203_02150 [Oecophyllibacter saccharovorans]